MYAEDMIVLCVMVGNVATLCYFLSSPELTTSSCEAGPNRVLLAIEMHLYSNVFLMYGLLHFIVYWGASLVIAAKNGNSFA